MTNASQKSSAVFIRRPLGVLILRGATRLDLIDRLSTQKVRELKTGEGAATIFTTEIGRMIDRVVVYADDEQVIALTGENFGESMGRYLLSYVFFNDDFQLVDRSAETAVLALYGTESSDLMEQLGVAGAADLALHHWQPVELAGHPATLHRTDPLSGEGYFLLLPADHLAEVKALLTDHGANQITTPEFEELRIKTGLPQLGRELTRDYIPLEAGLWDDVSFNKGCYVGQEIIARMESRGKLAKQLVALTADQPLTASTDITADGRTVGSITSAAGSNALGYVKTTALQKELPLTAGGVGVRVN